LIHIPTHLQQESSLLKTEEKEMSARKKWQRTKAKRIKNLNW